MKQTDRGLLTTYKQRNSADTMGCQRTDIVVAHKFSDLLKDLMKRTLELLILTVCWLSACDHTVTAADWPMWRNGVQRSGATDSGLPQQLSLRWSRQLLTPRPAWPNEPRLQFDIGYEPVASDQRLFVGSSSDGSVTAFDIVTGNQIWQFYTNGPVRLAPVLANGRIYVGSDDGFLYCLNAENGKLLWKQFGAPTERGQRRHLGNNRVISFWPVRGGPIVSDGVVYFGAGIWPTMGVFVHAADAETGELLWTNGNSNAIADVRIDHNYTHESSISPQGHLLLTDEYVIVPNGRSMPARLDRKTGKLQYFTQGYLNGDSRISVNGDIALVGRTGVVSLKDGREISSLWSKAGDKAPKSWSWEFDLFESPLFPYKFSSGCDYRSAIRNDIAFGIHDGTVYAYDLARAEINRRDHEKNNRTYRPAHWEPPQKWKLSTDFTDRKLPTHSVILAGDRLYSHCGPHLIAVDLPKDDSDQPAVAWTQQLPSVPASLIAAQDRLIVSTRDGFIHCFDSHEESARQIPLPDAPSDEIDEDTRQQVETILRTTDTSAGFAVVLGATNTDLISELLTQSELTVIAVEPDAEQVKRIRQQLISSGRFPDRLQLIAADPATTDLPAYLARLLVVTNPEYFHPDHPELVQRLFNTVQPYGGSACVFAENSEQLESLSQPFAKCLPQVSIKTTEEFIVLNRPGALPGSANWTHDTADAGRSFYSEDELVKAPLGVLWYGDGPGYGFYKRNDYGHGIKPQIADGRIFLFQTSSLTLYALNAYTGRVLWTRKAGKSPRYASMPDAVYLGDGRRCLVLDPETGNVRKTFEIDVAQPPDVPVSVSDVRVDGNIVLIAVRFNDSNAIPQGRWNSQLIVCLDRSSGKQLWSRPATQRFNTAAIAVANERVFCIDSHSPEDISTMKRRGTDVQSLPSTVLTLDTRTGKEVWKKVTTDQPAVMESIHFISLRARDDWLAFSKEHNILIFGKDNQTYAVDAATGDNVWQMPKRGHQPLIVGPTTFINQAGHTYDIASGKLISDNTLFRRGGCNYAVGSRNLVFLRSNCAAYVDVESGTQTNLRNLRSGCSNSLVAANGLLNAPCFSMGCICNYPIQTSFAMKHMPETASWQGHTPVKQERPIETPSLEE